MNLVTVTVLYFSNLGVWGEEAVSVNGASFVLTDVKIFLIIVLLLIVVLLITGGCLDPDKGMGVRVGNSGAVGIPRNDDLVAALGRGNVFLPSTYNNGTDYNRYGIRILRNNNRVLSSRGPRFAHGRVGSR